MYSEVRVNGHHPPTAAKLRPWGPGKGGGRRPPRLGLDREVYMGDGPRTAPRGGDTNQRWYGGVQGGINSRGSSREAHRTSFIKLADQY